MNALAPCDHSILDMPRVSIRAGAVLQRTQTLEPDWLAALRAEQVTFLFAMALYPLAESVRNFSLDCLINPIHSSPQNLYL
jgi:hypothetical protein